MSEEIITLDSLKNPDNNNISLEIEECGALEKEETHLDYKKKLNKKVSEFTEEEKKHYNLLAQKKNRKKIKTEEEKKQNQEDEKLDNEKRNSLFNQLFVLKEKFPDNLQNIHINKEMNIKTLEEKKELIVKIITQKHSHNVVFESLLLLCRTGERTLDYFDINTLEGYSENVEEVKDDIVPVLKEMIDMGEISTEMLTPQLRLAIIMSSVAVKTMEKNNDRRKNEVLADTISAGSRHGEDGDTS